MYVASEHSWTRGCCRLTMSTPRRSLRLQVTTSSAAGHSAVSLTKPLNRTIITKAINPVKGGNMDHSRVGYPPPLPLYTLELVQCVILRMVSFN